MSGFPRAFYLVTGLATVTFMTSTIIQPFFSLYVAQTGATSIQLGLIVSLLSYTTLISRLPLGLAAGRLGIWWVVPTALVGQSASYLLYSLASNPLYFYPIRIFHALALASLQPTLMSITSTILPEGRKGEGIGIYLTSVGISMMGGSLLSSLLLSSFNYRSILILSSVMPLSVLPLYIALRRNEALGLQMSRDGGRESLYKPTWSNLKRLVTLKPLQHLTYGRFTFAVSMSIITTLYPIYTVNHLQIEPSIYALFITLRGVANSLARLPTGRMSDLWGRKKPLLTAFTLLAAVFLLFSQVQDAVTIGAVMFLYGVGHGIRAVSEWSFLGDMVSRERRSLANFYFSSIFDLGSALGATFAGSAAMLLAIPDILKIASLILGSSIPVIYFIKTHELQDEGLTS